MSDIEHVMRRIARIQAADQDLDVQVRGNLAYAKRGKVVLPAIECYAYLGDDAERMIHGFCDHECGHAADTDFDVWEKEREARPEAWGELLNAVEDGYVEGRRGLLYRGCKQNLASKNEWFWEREDADGWSTQKQIAKAGKPPEAMCERTISGWSGFLLGVTMHVRPYGSHSIEEIEKLNPEIGKALRLVESELDKVADLFDETLQTPKCVEIANAIWDLVTDPESEGPTPPPDGAASDEAEPGDDGEGDGEGKGAMFAEMELERWTKEPGSVLNPEQAIQVEIQSIFEKPEDLRPYIVFDPSHDMERDFSAEDLSDLSETYEGFKTEAAFATDALVLAFESALKAMRMKRPVAGADQGEVDPSLLAEYAVGSADPDTIYTDYVSDDDDQGVVVAVLIDCSGSMGNGHNAPSHLARMCAIALGEALGRCQVPHEITGFTTLSASYSEHHSWAQGYQDRIDANFSELRRKCEEAEARGTDLWEFARTWWGDDLMVPFHAIFKSFTAEDRRGLCHVAGLSQNLDGEAVLWQARRLACRSERRRVLFVLSDGYPAGSHDNAQGARYLEEAVRRVINAGIEVYGLGMQSEAVAEFYPVHWVCNDLSDLASLAMTALIETLTRRRTERQWIEVL